MSKKIPKRGPSEPASSKKVKSSDQLPSKLECDTCNINMYNELYKCSLSNESLSPKEKVVHFDKIIYRFERIPVDAITNEIINLKRLKQIEVEKIEQAEATRAKKNKNNQASEEEQNKVAERMTFLGKKGAFVTNSAHYYFNINNPFGLHLPAEKINHIANMLCANFKAENGSFLDPRQTKAGLRMGLNMDQKGEVVLK